MTQPTKNSSILRGIIPPMVTPLLGRDELDISGLERLVEHVIAGGVHGLFILGTTGEGPSLSHALRRELIATTTRLVAGRVPVLVGITDTCLVESIEIAKFSADAGVSAVVTSAPHYFQLAQPELVDYLEELLKDLPLPLVLYNMPSLTKVSFELDTVEKLLSHEKVIGIKDSSGDIEYATGLLKRMEKGPGWSLMTGPEEILADTLRAGVDGGVCGGANLFPRLFVDIYEADQQNDLDKVQALHEDVLQLSSLLYSIGSYESAFIKGVKCALSCLGICSDYMAPPLHQFQKPERRIVQQRLQQISQLKAEGIRTIMESYSNCE